MRAVTVPERLIDRYEELVKDRYPNATVSPGRKTCDRAGEVLYQEFYVGVPGVRDGRPGAAGNRLTQEHVVMLYPNETIVHDGNAHLYRQGVTVDGEHKSRGLIPRDFARHPVGMFAKGPPMADVLEPIPEGEWTRRIADQLAARSRNSDVRMTGDAGQPIPSLDQDGVGYCWAHSSASSVMLVRAQMGEPYVPLSAFAVAATIKHGADEGGWGCQSLDFIVDRGVPAQSVWPQGDRNYQQYDRPETWANAALHKAVETYMDLQTPEYDRKLSWAQQVTTCLLNLTGPADFNWWSHSVCRLDVVNGASAEAINSCRAESGKLLIQSGILAYDRVWAVDHPITRGLGKRIWNSWGDSWSSTGMGVLTGNQAIEDGGAALRAVRPSSN